MCLMQTNGWRHCVRFIHVSVFSISKTKVEKCLCLSLVFALLLSTSVCLKSTSPHVKIIVLHQHGLMSLHWTVSLDLHCLEWACRERPQFTLWPVTTGLWNECSQGPSAACLTSARRKIGPNTSDPLQQRQWRPGVDVGVFIVSINSTDAASVNMQCAVSCSIPALCQLYVPALICQSQLLEILPPLCVCFHTEPALVFTLQRGVAKESH